MKNSEFEAGPVGPKPFSDSPFGEARDFGLLVLAAIILCGMDVYAFAPRLVLRRKKKGYTFEDTPDVKKLTGEMGISSGDLQTIVIACAYRCVKNEFQSNQGGLKEIAALWDQMVNYYGDVVRAQTALHEKRPELNGVSLFKLLLGGDLDCAWQLLMLKEMLA